MGAAKSGAELTRRLLSFSRQQVLETTVIDINEMVRDTETLLRRTLGEQISLETSLDRKVSLGVTDRNQLESALLNLCINARDAMPKGGRLTIETRHTYLDELYAATRSEVTPGPYVEISVSDTGTGIPPELLDKIFEPFFTTKESGKGTGLGLSTIFGFMKQSGGHLAVYSEIGHGTTFKLYVPEAEPAKEALAEEVDAVVRDVAGATVLVVEDDESVREIAVSLLGEEGYRVIEAESGPDGLAAFNEHPEIDMVFSDVVMPGGMTGPEMVEKIRMQRPEIPVLFASGYAEQALRDRETLMESAGFIAKPYDVNDLPRKIESILEAMQ
jgi:CheY-like chemotaxis protein